MKIDLKRTERKKVWYAVTIGILFAAGPFLFWRIFLQQLPLTGSTGATISERFQSDDREFAPEPSSTSRPRLRELLAYPAHSLVLDHATGMLRMYEQGTGRAFEVNPRTLTVLTLSEARLENLEHTIWSPNGTEVLSLFREEEGSTYRYFDYHTDRVAVLPANIRALAFSPDGSRIISTRRTDTQLQLWVSAPDGSDEWLLMATRLDIADIDWIRDDTIALLSRQPDETMNLLLLDLDTNLRLLLEDYAELDVLWARGGQHALISYMNDEHERVMGVLDVEREEITPLSEAIRASKCVWHRRSSITCGVPGRTDSGARDIVVTLDLLSGEKTVRFRAADDIWVGIQDPVALKNGNGIAFINIFDKRPYLITW